MYQCGHFNATPTTPGNVCPDCVAFRTLSPGSNYYYYPAPPPPPKRRSWLGNIEMPGGRRGAALNTAGSFGLESRCLDREAGIRPSSFLKRKKAPPQPKPRRG